MRNRTDSVAASDDFELGEAAEVLSRTPRVLEHLLAGLSDAWVRSSEGPGTFTPFDVMGHLIDAEEAAWIPRARAILFSAEPPRFGPFDRFRHRERDAERTLTALLAEFAERRNASLVELNGWHLGRAELERRGIHPEFGEVSLRQLLATWVVHDLSHLAQIERVMAGRYRAAVGPWRAFLRILTR